MLPYLGLKIFLADKICPLDYYGLYPGAPGPAEHCRLRVIADKYCQIYLERAFFTARAIALKLLPLPDANTAIFIIPPVSCF
jgi:hypothetical protein